MQLLLHNKGIVVGKRNNCFHIRTDKHERIISPARVSSIAVCAFCMLSSAAIKLAIEHEIPIYFLDAYGHVVGRLGGASFGNQAGLRRQQVFFRESPMATEWLLGTLRLKIEEQIANLKYLANRKQAFASILNETIEQMNEIANSVIEECKGKLIDECADFIRGKEGSIARYYWQALSQVMPPPLEFEGRIHQNPPDAFNSTINYYYGMLYGIVETAIFSVGLDPYLGILHDDQVGKPTLSYDLIEPFRPLVDRLLIEMALTNKINDDYYTKEAEGTRISKKGKGVLIPAFFEWLEEKILMEDTLPRSRKNQIYQQAGLLKNFIVEFSKSQKK